MHGIPHRFGSEYLLRESAVTSHHVVPDPRAPICHLGGALFVCPGHAATTGDTGQKRFSAFHGHSPNLGARRFRSPVARNLEGQLIAASQVCSHEAYDQVRFVDQQGGIFYCDVHGSRFEQNGTPLNQVDANPAKALKIYNIELTGDMLRVFE